MIYTIFIKEFLKKYASVERDKALLFQYLREELQYLLLRIVFTKQIYPVIFMGGTHLRLSYGMNRFSEDLDFSLDKPDKNFPADEFFSSIAKAFTESRSGFRVHMRTSLKRNVAKGIISFAQILFDLGLAPIKDQTLKIKLEIDTNPPEHALLESKRYESLFGYYTVPVFDLPTSFAGKLGAVLQREYQKGRDYFDLQWYLLRKPRVPLNMPYLNANLLQQKGKGVPEMEDLIAAVSHKIDHVDLPLLKKDLERFVIMDERTFNDWIANYSAETKALLLAYNNSL